MSRRRLTLIVPLLTVLAAAPVLAQQAGTVHERLTIGSELMGEEVHYSIYLPPDYETASRSYPIVYLLHGFGDDDTGWIQMGEVDRIVDGAIATGELPPMIIVMPDGGVTWYINSADGSVPWEDMFLQELMPHVENEYRVREGKRFRGVAGLSMGGWGALTLSMRHPELFAGAAAFSAGVFPDESVVEMEQDTFDWLLGQPLGAGLAGEARITDHFRAHSPHQLAATADLEQLISVRYWIDCGDDDFLSANNGVLHAQMLEREIPHEYRVRDGQHSWEYWRSGLVAGLEFVTESFR